MKTHNEGLWISAFILFTLSASLVAAERIKLECTTDADCNGGFCSKLTFTCQSSQPPIVVPADPLPVSTAENKDNTLVGYIIVGLTIVIAGWLISRRRGRDEHG